MNYKPFDLDEAINGAELITRDGREVKQFTYYPTLKDRYKCRAVVEDSLHSFSEKGTFYLDDLEDSPEDIFMKPVTTTKYLHLYKDGGVGAWISHKITTAIDEYKAVSILKGFFDGDTLLSIETESL